MTTTWTFLTPRSLPDDPTARRLEKRGRWWLVVSYLLCPCHLPVTLSLLAVAFGGTALGSVVSGSTGWIAGAITAAYALVLWRGFRSIRHAKRLVAGGATLDCRAGECEVIPAGVSANR